MSESAQNKQTFPSCFGKKRDSLTIYNYTTDTLLTLQLIIIIIIIIIIITIVSLHLVTFSNTKTEENQHKLDNNA